MWVRILTLIYCILVILYRTCLIHCHVPSHISTPSSLVDQYCAMAETCIHDTIAVCGKLGEQKRTFLDLCDMIEYACDTNFVYNHIDDEADCPADIRL